MVGYVLILLHNGKKSLCGFSLGLLRLSRKYIVVDRLGGDLE